ncbi:MAG: DHA2 family efflux MFS transporter permease subunit [Solirubrobacterales bacterium]|nr:DHA2 family efflux MFS transporter permease subunit [Solirubrobacterales bacterium]
MEATHASATGRRATALAVASAGYFFVLLDVTIVNVALAGIGADLGSPRAGLQWVVDGYALALASLMLSAGDLADRLGVRRVFIAGLGVFALASAICALAPTAAVLIGGRALQGLGAAAILPTSLALVNELFPDPGERPRAIGAWAALGGSALVAGPVLGGIVVGGLGWRAIFWLNVPLAAAALLAAAAVLPRQGQTSGRRLDFAGQLLGATALVAIVFCLIEGQGSGSLALPIACALIAGAAGAAFLTVERRRREPMLEPRWFARADFSAANAAAALMNLGTLGALFAVSLFLQQDEGRSALQTGLALIPLAAPLALLTPLSGRLVAAVGPRRPAGLGLMLCGLAYAALSISGPRLTGVVGFCLLGLAGTGMAVAVPALVAGATEALGARRAGIASAINNTSRQVGGAIGVALIGGLSSFGAALALSAGALVLGGTIALAFLDP